MWHFLGWILLDISKDCNAFCLRGQAVPRLLWLLDREDERHCLPSNVPLASQKTWLFSNISLGTSDLWFPFVHCLVLGVVTVCVPCSWWRIKQNDGNKLQDARPLVDQVLFECTGHNCMWLFPTGCSVCAPVGAHREVDLLREARLYRASTLFDDCWLPLLLG